jgi:hypothetical protein
MTVGYAEVLLKRQQWRALDERGKISFLAGHALPGVFGPKGRRFIIDHHHLARALFKEHVELALFKVLADFSALDKREFWTVMDYRQWVHAYDAEGRKHPYGDLRKACPAWPTTRTEVWPRRFAWPVPSRRSKRPSPSSCGPISFADASPPSSWPRLPALPFQKHCPSRMTKPRDTFPAGRQAQASFAAGVRLGRSESIGSRGLSAGNSRRFETRTS